MSEITCQYKRVNLKKINILNNTKKCKVVK